MFQALSGMKVPLARFGYWIAILVMATYAFVSLRGPRGLPALIEKQRQIREMEERNAAMAREIERIREHIKRLSDNPTEQELEIRERLKLVRPGEKVYITGEPEKK